MSTITQEAKHLVLATTEFIEDTSSGDVGDIGAGQLGLIKSNGAGYNSGSVAVTDRLKLVLNTNIAAEPGSTLPLMLISEELTTNNIVSLGKKAYEAPYEAATLVTLPSGHDYNAGESVVIGLRFDAYGSVSMKNPYTRHGVYYVQNNADTNVEVAAALVASLNKNLDKDRTARANALVGGTDVAAQIGTTIDLVAGATVQDLTGAGTNASDVAGWALIDGNLYYVTGTSGGSSVTLNRPAETTAAATTPVNTTTEQIIIVAERQAQIDFEHPFAQINFNTTVTKDGSALGATILETGSSIGVGYGPHVRNIESFANQSTQRNQFVNKPRMYDERLQASASASYNVLNIKLKTTKSGSGSDVASVREISVYCVDSTSLDNLATALASLAPSASKNF